MSKVFWSRDAHAVQVHAEGARNFSCRTVASRGLLRAAAIAAAVQTNPDGLPAWKKYSNSRVLSRRGFARGSPAGIYAGGHRNVFIDREDIYALVEGLLKRIWKTALNIDVPTPFKRITFEEALTVTE